MEVWKDVVGYEGRYQVSNLGNVKSLQRWDCLNNRVHRREKNINPTRIDKGYMRVKLYDGNTKKSFSVHRLVAEAFIPNPFKKKQVNHIDGDKTNNNVENLEWCTNKENQIHARKYGLADNCRKKGKKVLQLDSHGNLLNEWNNMKSASITLNIRHSAICLCCKGNRKTAGGYMWKYKEAE